MKNSNGKFTLFLRKNALWLILSFCILAIGLSVTLMLVTGNKVPDNQIEKPIDPDDGKPDDPDDPDIPEKPDEPDKPVVTEIVFIMPVENATSVGEYSETMVFNSTLSRFTVHLATDFFAEEGTDVLAVYDGTVESVTNDLLKGYTVTIDHGNGLKTVYNSLADGDAVKAGQKVKQGDVIGQVSVTNRQEYKSGAHLHFEVMENNELIDPAEYLVFDEK